MEAQELTQFSFTNLETQIFNLINEGKNTIEEMQKHSAMKDLHLMQTLESLRTKNIIECEKNVWKFASKIEGDVVILDGNILLPTQFLRPGDGFTYVVRGNWYKFADEVLEDGTIKPFDVRRIIWNTVVEEKTNSTLVDMLRTDILRKQKQDIQPLEEHTNLKDKIFDYVKDSIRIKIMEVGKDISIIRIIFVQKIMMDKDDFIPFHGFFVESCVSTEELLLTLRTPLIDRNPSETLKLMKIHRFTDFLLNQNRIPIEQKEHGLIYMQINIKKKMIELQTYFQTNYGELNELELETFDDNVEAVKRLREIFEKYPTLLLNNVGMDVELVA